MKRTCALFLGILFLCAAFPSPALAQSGTAVETPLTPVEQLVDANGNVIFQDTVVEDAIRGALGILEGPVSQKQLAKLGANGDELAIVSSKPVTADLSVLQLCKSLKSLLLEQVTPVNLSAITAVKSLTYFGAKKIRITDLRFLVGIGGLADVWIGECPCTDISAVMEMPNLSSFSIDTYVPDITPLYACKKLTGVSVAKLTDAQVNALLDQMERRLTDFGILNSSITVSTLERISRMKLRFLMLDGIPVYTIDPVWNMLTLETLHLFNIRITSLEGIQNLTKLQQVALIKTTGLADYNPLFQLKNLKSLRFLEVKAPDLKSIANLKNLEELELGTIFGNLDLTPAFALAKLKRLSLNGVQIATIAGIEGLVSLTDLSLYRISGLTDYSPLSGLKKLQSVSTDAPAKIPAGLPVG